jgi:1,4-alpha-glucan branching enzyme
MRFVLTLHSHLPWVLHHGRWPHGSDWLSEATLDTYLPLLAWLDQAEREEVPVALTLGITPILAAQLAHPSFREEVDAYFAHRLETVADADESLRKSGDDNLLPLVPWWRRHLQELQQVWQQLDGDLLGAFRRHAEAGRIELISSAATHGFLPLLGRDESIRLQLLVGRAEHLRHFGDLPLGCWAPECAYRPAGPWNPWPGAPAAEHRAGIEDHLRYAGFRWFTVDPHLATSGERWQIAVQRSANSEQRMASGEQQTANSDSPVVRVVGPTVAADQAALPYRAYTVAPVVTRGRQVHVLVRDPDTTAQVWSRHGGYPGDGRYLEFHKIRYPGGLKFWRVTSTQADLGAKEPYVPRDAADAVRWHADHFREVLDRAAAGAEHDGAIVAPFDTELFGHWWFEGVDWLRELFAGLQRDGRITPVGGSRYLAELPPETAVALQAGSWGRDGDFSMWLSEEVAWTWQRLWPLEERFWNAVPEALRHPAVIPVLEQAARELLLAQSSDWQFIISTGAAGDYAIKRFNEHCDALESLLPALESGTGDLSGALAAAARLHEIDAPFPSLVGAIAAASDVPPA